MGNCLNSIDIAFVDCKCSHAEMLLGEGGLNDSMSLPLPAAAPTPQPTATPTQDGATTAPTDAKAATSAARHDRRRHGIGMGIYMGMVWTCV